MSVNGNQVDKILKIILSTDFFNFNTWLRNCLIDSALHTQKQGDINKLNVYEDINLQNLSYLSER